MGGLASEKLGEYRRMLVAAILRSFDAPFVPEDYLHEPVLGMSSFYRAASVIQDHT